MISRNALDGRAKIAWAFREAPVNPVDNGWRFLSAIDDDAYLENPDNMAVVPFNTVVEIEPAVLPILYLPEGTEITIERSADGHIRLVDSRTDEPLRF